MTSAFRLDHATFNGDAIHERVVVYETTAANASGHGTALRGNVASRYGHAVAKPSVSTANAGSTGTARCNNRTAGYGYIVSLRAVSAANASTVASTRCDNFATGYDNARTLSNAASSNAGATGTARCRKLASTRNGQRNIIFRLLLQPSPVRSRCQLILRSLFEHEVNAPYCNSHRSKRAGLLDAYASQRDMGQLLIGIKANRNPIGGLVNAVFHEYLNRRGGLHGKEAVVPGEVSIQLAADHDKIAELRTRLNEGAA